MKIQKSVMMILGGMMSAASLHASTMLVDWGNSSSYVSGNTAITSPAFAYITEGSSRTANYIYSSSTPSVPASGYITPVGKTGVFYSGTTITALNSTANRPWSFRHIQDGGSDSEYIYYQRGGSADTGYSASSFTAFLKEDFLNNGANPSLQIALPDLESLSMTVVSSAGSTAYFAVQDGSQWYIAQTGFTGTGSKLLGGSDLENMTWGLWNPNGGANSRLGDLPENFISHDFSNITGFGVFTSYSVGMNSSTNFGMSAFTVTSIPEPATVGLLAFGASAMLYLRGRSFSSRREQN